MSWKQDLREYWFGSDVINLDCFRRPLPQLRFRPYDQDDFDRCSEIYRLNEKGRFPEGYLQCFQDSLRSEEALYIVAEAEGVLVGFGGVSISEYSDDFQTANIVFGLVDPAYHRKGYGTAIFAFRLAQLDASRSEWLVEMTSAGNGTELFFKKLGFTYDGTFTDDDGATLEAYHLRVPRRDLNRLRKLFADSENCIGKEIEIPRKDFREVFLRLVEEQKPWQPNHPW